MSRKNVSIKPKKVRKGLVIGVLFIALVIGLWWGVPTYRKAKADAMVDGLCAKDGGIKVYETVKLPASRFDQYGNVHVPFEPKPGEEYYLKMETGWVVPYTGEGNISIAREDYKIYRVVDGKMLGEAVTYLRRGGGPPSPAHPSSYRCPKDVSVSKKVFVRE